MVPLFPHSPCRMAEPLRCALFRILMMAVDTAMGCWLGVLAGAGVAVAPTEGCLGASGCGLEQLEKNSAVTRRRKTCGRKIGCIGTHTYLSCKRDFCIRIDFSAGYSASNQQGESAWIPEWRRSAVRN